MEKIKSLFCINDLLNITKEDLTDGIDIHKMTKICTFCASGKVNNKVGNV